MNSAISTNFLLWALLIFCCPDPGWTSHAEEMASLEVKMTNIMDRMTRMEADMEGDTRIAALREEMATKEEMMKAMKDSLERKESRITALETAMEEKEQEMMILSEETELEVREMVEQVRNPASAFYCAWQDYWITDDSIITYDRQSSTLQRS